jgi:hypothetical protein
MEQVIPIRAAGGRPVVCARFLPNWLWCKRPVPS